MEVPLTIVKGFALATAIYLLLFFGLTKTGLLGPDEPRYASIGREMSLTGDWVTPRLWGEPWFEKPALQYWMTGLAFRMGLGDDLAPRLPIALMSLAFLIFFQRLLAWQFGDRESWFATAILATATGWLAFSQLSVPDLPLAATFGASVICCLPWIDDRGSPRLLLAAGVLLGAAVLAKGLVPLVLIAPIAWYGRRRLGDLLTLGGFALVTAAPWYVMCTLENGMPFIEEFFVRHHFSRFVTSSLQHVQPIWFYVPVLLVGLLPWSPLILLLFRRDLYRDRRLQFLAVLVAFGMVFFSASSNKLPGYLLPLFPPLAVLLGVALARTTRARAVLLCSAALLAVLPVAVAVLPEAIRRGLPYASMASINWLPLIPVGILAGLVWWGETQGRRSLAVAGIAAGVVLGVFYLKVEAYPVLDREVSARGLWREVAPRYFDACVEDIHRSWRYGLNYYSLDPLPSCAEDDRPFHVRMAPDGQAVIGRR